MVGGDGMVHLGVQAVAGTGTPLGIIPAGTGNDVARYFDLPRKDPVAAADRVVAGQTRDGRPGPQRQQVLRDRAGRRLRRDRQRAGQPDDLAQGPDALQPRHPGRAADLQAAAVHARPRRRAADRSTRCWSRSATARRFGGGLRITEGALLDDGLLDVVIIKPMSRGGLVRTYPKLFKGTHVTHPQYEHHRVRAVTVAAPGHRVVRRRRALRRAAADRRVRSGSVDRPRLATVRRLGRVSTDELSPSERYADYREDRKDHPVFRDFSAPLRLPARRLPGARLPGDRGGPRRAGRGPDRLRQDDRGRVRRPPGPGDRPQVLLHDPDQGAVEPEVQRPRGPLRRPTRSGC